jgi:hypothetical protein
MFPGMSSSSASSRPGAPRPSRRLYWSAALSFSLGATGLGAGALSACDDGSDTIWVWECRIDGKRESALTRNDPNCPCACCINPIDGAPLDDTTCGLGGDAGADGDADAPLPSTCIGTCVPAKPDGWDDPQLLAIGTSLARPSCPGVAPAVIYEGYAGLDTSLASCVACSCAPPVGSCALPATVTASTSAACPDDGPDAILTAFDPPTHWDGGCTSEGAIPSGAPCGAMPCNRSLTIAPLAVHESACTPSASPGTMIHAISWNTYAIACIGNAAGSCAENGDFCAALEPVDGFRECIFHDGDVDCPSYSAYTDRHVFYTSADDTRSCSACTCGSPVGSTCAAEVSVYTDSACSSLLFADAVTASATSCIDVPAGSMLGSKSAGPATYTPGSCPPSGGEPTGSVAPVMPGTFCCLPSP